MTHDQLVRFLLFAAGCVGFTAVWTRYRNDGSPGDSGTGDDPDRDGTEAGGDGS